MGCSIDCQPVLRHYASRDFSKIDVGLLKRASLFEKQYINKFASWYSDNFDVSNERLMSMRIWLESISEKGKKEEQYLRIYSYYYNKFSKGGNRE